MNLDTQSTPRPQNYGRFDSVIFFSPTTNPSLAALSATSGWINLGNCTAAQQKSGQKGADVMRNRGGTSTRVDSPVTSLSPELDITINEVRFRKAIPTRIFGTQGPDAVQASATASTISFPAVYQLMTFDLGKRVVSNVVVKIGTSTGTVAVADTDYQVDLALGNITIMEGAIPDSTAMTPSAVFVTFDCAAITRATFTEYSKANAYGFLRWFEEDAFGPAAEKIAYVNLVPGDPGSNDNTKYRDDKLNAKILGTVQRFERKD